MTVERFLGLMSGTSLDGVDAVVVAIETSEGKALETAGSVSASVEAHTHWPMPSSLKQTLLECQRGEPLTIQALCELDNTLGGWFGDATQNLLSQWGGDKASITAIGSPGQTVGHYPQVQASCQLGNPSVIAAKTGVPVVSHFRQGDLALGGQGAPLVPWVEALLYSHETVPRYLINIGGMANATLVPPRVNHANQPVWQWPLVAMDTGPGNVWMDAACHQFFGAAYDDGGAYASQGVVHDPLLTALFAEPSIAEFLAQPAPKSTGRDLFSVERLSKVLDSIEGEIAPHDVLATLTVFTANTVAQGLLQLAQKNLQIQQAADVWVTGGGALNPVLMQALTQELATLLPTAALHVGDPLGLHPQYKEPLAFALLAWARWHALPSNNPSATGAKNSTPLGAVWLPPVS